MRGVGGDPCDGSNSPPPAIERYQTREETIVARGLPSFCFPKHSHESGLSWVEEVPASARVGSCTGRRSYACSPSVPQDAVWVVGSIRCPEPRGTFSRHVGRPGTECHLATTESDSASARPASLARDTETLARIGLRTARPRVSRAAGSEPSRDRPSLANPCDH